MKTRTKVINGKSIDYLDVVHHTTTTKFKMWDRIKILFGKEIITQSELYTNHDHCLILGTTAKSYVPPIIRRKEKGGVCMTPMDTQENRDYKIENILK
jgi:hypothetical protein